MAFDQAILRVAVRDRGEDPDVLGEKKATGITTDDLGIKISEEAPDAGGPFRAHLGEELKEGLSNGGTGGVEEAVAPALSRAGIHNDEAVAVATRGHTITKADVDT
ncbi:MAG: hypothetical protein ACRCYW_02390 [Aeromonas sp.]|uniref:hypothetical protein n=1 Tax=Aeromonas sp. TaxID=647 RepID=UPI003F33967D